MLVVFQTLTGTVKRRLLCFPARVRSGVSNPHRYGQKMTAEERAEQKRAFQTLIGTVKSFLSKLPLTRLLNVSNPHRYGQKVALAHL